MKKTITIIGIIALVAVLGVCLVACIPNNYSKAAANLKDEGYTVISFSKDDDGFEAATKFLGVENIVAFVSANKLLAGDGIVLIYFDSASSAKSAYSEIEKQYEKQEKMSVKRSGKVIYAGTEQAIKDAQ